ncbi:ATP-binding protein [Acinetobacter baumannii]|nr:ATP-binding protein [Acinetobacter baumannii]
MLNQIYEKIESLLSHFEELKNNALTLDPNFEHVNNIDFSSNVLISLKNELMRVEGRIPDNYLRIFIEKLTEIQNNTPFRSVYAGHLDGLDLDHRDHLLGMINNSFTEGSYPLVNINDILFNINMFGKFDYLSGNIVAIGANGSGKSTLSEYLKESFGVNGQIISAQKLLIIPTFSSISSVSNTEEKLRGYQVNHNNFKSTYKAESSDVYSILNVVGGEFKALLDNLLAERIYFRNKYCDIKSANPEITEKVPLSKLDKVIQIWNSLIQHRELFCDGVNIYLRSDTHNDYQACLMSDGEKVALYHIAHIIQAPRDGFIIIDEPEIYLHKSILNKLWDALENERNDCVFMYLTHDIDFASTRYSAKKLWIKSFKYPNIWDIEKIPDDSNLPENLLLELLGSRKNILFCEGEVGKIDDAIYNILFPNHTIRPVRFCHAVINYTKAFNMLGMTTTKAYGIIDSDHHTQARLDSYKTNNIFALYVAEAENLLLDEKFLKLLGHHLLIVNIDEVVNTIKQEIIDFLEQNKTTQAANYISSKIDFYFKDSNLTEGKTYDEVTQNFSEFISKISILDEYNNRIELLNNIISTNNYEKVLQVFNHKGLKNIIERNFKIRDFKERAILFLKKNEEAQNILKDYFDENLK